ncbi:MAG: ABC transporter permease [Mycobacteriales bacterium]
MPVDTAKDPAGTARDDSIATLEAGLDALTVTATARRPLGRRIAAVVLPALVAFALVVAIWELLYLARVKPHYLLPSPWTTAKRFGTLFGNGDIPKAMWLSVSRGMLGFAISILIGTPLGILVARVRYVRSAVKPVLSGLQCLPSVAWVPAAILWFGLSNSTIYFVVLMGAVPSIAVGMVSGLDQIPPLYVRVGTVMGARGLRSVYHVLVPAALPGYLGGLRQGWAFAWRSLMAAELITQSPELGTGLGQLLDKSRETIDAPGAIALIITILFVGMTIELLVFAPTERAVLRRRGLKPGA